MNNNETPLTPEFEAQNILNSDVAPVMKGLQSQLKEAQAEITRLKAQLAAAVALIPEEAKKPYWDCPECGFRHYQTIGARCAACSKHTWPLPYVDPVGDLQATSTTFIEEQKREAVAEANASIGVLVEELTESVNAIEKAMEETPQEWWNSEAGQELKGGYLEWVVRGNKKVLSNLPEATRTHLERQRKMEEALRRIAAIKCGCSNPDCEQRIARQALHGTEQKDASGDKGGIES